MQFNSLSILKNWTVLIIISKSTGMLEMIKINKKKRLINDDLVTDLW